MISEVAKPDTLESVINPCTSALVLDRVKPLMERFFALLVLVDVYDHARDIEYVCIFYALLYATRYNLSTGYFSFPNSLFNSAKSSLPSLVSPLL